MKMSQVTISDLKKYVNVFHDEDDIMFLGILAAGKQFISSYTGLPLVTYDGSDNCDNHEQLTIALWVVCAEMYDNRTIQAENDKLNFVIRTILDSHAVNFL